MCVNITQNNVHIHKTAKRKSFPCIGATVRAIYYGDGLEYPEKITARSRDGWSVVFDGYEDGRAQDTKTANITVISMPESAQASRQGVCACDYVCMYVH
jgi:hypothetical protein